MKSETNVALRTLIALALGAVGGLVAAAMTRIIFDLPIDPKTMLGIWKALIPAAIGGAIVMLLSTTLMAQSPPNIGKGAVIFVLFIASAVLGVIAAAGLLLIIRFVGGDFFQGRTFKEAAMATGASGVISAVVFLICVPIRGFDHPHTGRMAGPSPTKAAAKTPTKVGSKGTMSGIQNLRRCPTCGTVIAKAYKPKDPEAEAKGQKLYICNNGHEWHA